ncbi:MAG TPA: hypothetical protein VHV78_08465 [Gemmatimonadaceae bacterium]|nr:hypothetical protein [Gemmatimonadaceae bacterium]
MLTAQGMLRQGGAPGAASRDDAVAERRSQKMIVDRGSMLPIVTPALSLGTLTQFERRLTDAFRNERAARENLRGIVCRIVVEMRSIDAPYESIERFIRYVAHHESQGHDFQRACIFGKRLPSEQLIDEMVAWVHEPFSKRARTRAIDAAHRWRH